MSKQQGYLKDHRGKSSYVRVASAFCVATAIFLAVSSQFQAFAGGAPEMTQNLVLVFLVAGFAPKVVQRFAEQELEEVGGR